MKPGHKAAFAALVVKQKQIATQMQPASAEPKSTPTSSKSKSLLLILFLAVALQTILPTILLIRPDALFTLSTHPDVMWEIFDQVFAA